MSEGIYFSLPDRKIYLFEQYKKQYLDRLKVFRDACAAAIGNDVILICIENCGAYHGFQQEAIELLLESPCFALTYGHDYCAGGGNEAFIIGHADRLRHIHIHDAAEDSCHLPLGTGEIDISDKLTFLRKHHCRYVLGAKTSAALRQSVEYLEKLRFFTHLP
jgi:sugar phosphate isomerase/epimerase